MVRSLLQTTHHAVRQFFEAKVASNTTDSVGSRRYTWTSASGAPCFKLTVCQSVSAKAISYTKSRIKPNARSVLAIDAAPLVSMPVRARIASMVSGTTMAWL